MSDGWEPLRNNIRNIGAQSPNNTFSSPLLDDKARAIIDPSLVPVELGDRTTGGGTTLFSDAPEAVAFFDPEFEDTRLVNGSSIPSGTPTIILFAETGGLTAGTRYRVFIHHLNRTPFDNNLSIVATNRGTQEVILTKNPMYGTPGNDFSGTFATKRLLNAIPANSAVPNADLDILVTDAFPDPTTRVPIPPFDLSNPSTIKSLGCVLLHPGDLGSHILEIIPEGPNICIFVVMNNPPTSAYDPSGDTGNYTAASTQYKRPFHTPIIHDRGTFEERIVSRITTSPYVIATGLETPGRFQLVDPTDQNWVGADDTLWDSSAEAHNVGYGRMFYSRVTVSNSSGNTLNVGVVASPRTPSSKYWGEVSDVGAGITWRVPFDASGNNSTVVQRNERTSGTLLWSGTVPPSGAVNKRLRYTMTGASSGKLSLWVVPYS